MPVAVVARVFDTQANQSFEATFERFPVRVGRNALNDLPIDRPYVSQFHAAVDVRDDRQLFIRDLGSTNGTLFQGQRIARDLPVDITPVPEFAIGPCVIRLGLVAAQPKAETTQTAVGVLDGRQPAPYHTAPGAEDAFVRQVVPYIDAYRQAWQTVYRVMYDHLARLPTETRALYLRRLGLEHSSVSAEGDFRKIAQYYGVDLRSFAAAGPAQAALAALSELAQSLAPGSKQPEDDVASVLAFAKRTKETLEVFLKAFISLRDGYQVFETEVLARDHAAAPGRRLSGAKNEKDLGNFLLGASAGPDVTHQLYDSFRDIMAHQNALLNGVMEGVRSLLLKLSPKTLEAEFERTGKKGGLFSNRFEALWKLYEVRHGDYDGEEKEVFLTIFGPQFSRAYAASAGERYQGEKPPIGARYPANAGANRRGSPDGSG